MTVAFTCRNLPQPLDLDVGCRDLLSGGHNGPVPRPPRPEIAPPPPGQSRYAALVAYDGGAFHGFAANPDVETVAGAIDTALSQVLSADIRTTCAGRTDTGVHGWGQVVSFDGPSHIDTGRVQHSLNRMLGPRIVVRDLSAVTDDFDARFSAESRTYRYRVLNRPVGDPFHHDLTAARAALGPHVDEPVGGADHVQVVLDDDERVPGVNQRAKGAQPSE